MDKLSSPERLDRMIPVVSPSFWISMIGCGIVIAAALIWACIGKIPDIAAAPGIYTGSHRVYSVAAQTDGILSEICVSVGERAEEGQTIAVIQMQDSAGEKTNLSDREVKASKSGTVTEIVASEGSLVSDGTELVRIAGEGSTDENTVILFAPLAVGKKVFPGMPVKIHPTTVNEQEYGHMEGTVTHVDDFAASSDSINSILGNDTLTDYFTRSGPVVVITCSLKKDDGTVSGFWWSGAKGKDLTLNQDTILSVDVITDTKRPVELAVPMLKNLFGRRNGAQGSND